MAQTGPILSVSTGGISLAESTGELRKNPARDGSPLEGQAQPQESVDAPSRPRTESQLSGDTLLTNAVPGDSQSRADLPTADTLVHNASSRKPSRSSTLNTWLRRSSSSAGTAGGQVQTPSWFGISFDYEDNSGKRIWIIKITKLGLWIVGIHICLGIAGLFDLITSIYSWVSSANNNTDKMLQKILKGVSDSGAQLKGVDEKLLNWIEAAKVQPGTEDARMREEQRLWDALLKVFEDCATSQSRPNATNACNNIRQYFDHNPLPRPDRSPISKRNLAKLDVIIQREHLGTTPTGPPLDYLGHGNRVSRVALGVVSLLTTTLMVFACFLVLRNWVPQIFNRLGAKAKKKYHNADEKSIEAPDITDHAVPTFTSGFDFHVAQSSLLQRGHHRNADAHAIAARGTYDELIAQFETDRRVDVDRVDEVNEYGTLLAASARSGDVRKVNYILSKGAELSLEGGRYHNALQAAAHSGSRLAVDRLLAAGARETSVGGFYGNAVNAAAEKGNSSMLASLLKASTFGAPAAEKDVSNPAAIVNQPGGTYGYPLIAAAARGHHDSVQLLLDSGAHVNQPCNCGTIALHQAAARGDVLMMDLLFQKDSSIDQQSMIFGTPLHAACRDHQMIAAQKLLEQGANPAIKDQRFRTPLHEAAGVKGGLDQVVCQILHVRPELVNEVDIDGNTALHLASIAGNTDVVKALLENNADCGIGDKFDAQPLFRAAGCGHSEIVKELLETGMADVNATDCFGRTALHGPAQTHDVSVHRYLIENHADVNIVGNDKKTALHEACNMGRIANVELLLARPGIKINELDNDQYPPLFKALCSSDAHEDYFDKCVEPKIVEKLLEREDLNVNVSNGIAVQEAARKGFDGYIETMLSKHKANVRIQGSKYGSVLQAAAISGNQKLINLLLKPEHHVDVNSSGGEFGCPLAAAAAFGHVNIVRRLLDAGADARVSGTGRYGSPSHSICQKVDATLKARDAHKWKSIAMQIRNLLEDYGGLEVEKVERLDEDWRWHLGTSGWDFAPPGEM